MAIGVRDVTNLEELLEVQDDDKIIVIQNGDAKLVSKANAKFGGGTVTIFYMDENETRPNTYGFSDANGNPVSPQAAYDAVMSGPVYFKKDNAVVDEYIIPYGFAVMTMNGVEINSIIFTAKDRTDKSITFYSEANPSGGEG